MLTVSQSLERSADLHAAWQHAIRLVPAQDIKGGTHGRPLAILNLMPDRPHHEYLWISLLAGCGFHGSIQFVTTHSYTPKSTSHAYLEQNYVDTRAADDMDPLAYIVTGAPLGVRLKRFEDAAYWAELTALFDRAKARNIPVLGVCWGGNALMYHRHGIALQRLPVKSIGLFDHATGVHATDFGLQVGVTLPIPVARMSGFGPRDSVDYENILTDLEHPRLGPCLLRSVSGLDYAVGNHLEYDTATLRTEYDRDRGRGLTLDAAMTRLDTAAPWRPIAVQVYRHWLSTVVKP